MNDLWGLYGNPPVDGRRWQNCFVFNLKKKKALLKYVYIYVCDIYTYTHV